LRRGHFHNQYYGVAPLDKNRVDDLVHLLSHLFPFPPQIKVQKPSRFLLGEISNETEMSPKLFDKMKSKQRVQNTPPEKFSLTYMTNFLGATNPHLSPDLPDVFDHYL
jgi:hypothetical protein